MTIILVILAGAMIALSNLSMRKSIDGGRKTNGFLVFQMASGCLFSILLNPFRSGDYTFSLSIACFGLVVGLVLSVMLFFLGKALEKGPPGLTFSILSAGTVFPGLLMAIFLGASQGFPYTLWHAVGSLVVICGLFWAGKELAGLQDAKRWILFAILMFSLHVILLALFQWRAFLMKLSYVEESVSFFSAKDIQSQWFLPFMFLGAAFIQFFIYIVTERRRFHPREISYGILGGLANSIGVFFLLWSTEVATPLQNAVIFPVHSVAIIVLCNLWGQKLYDEKINWRACQLCIFGLLIATVDWSGLASAIGFKFEQSVPEGREHLFPVKEENSFRDLSDSALDSFLNEPNCSQLLGQ